MAKPFFFTENFFNDIIFTNHLITANQEIVGNEAVLVGTARRELNSWIPVTKNQQAWIEVECDQPRMANCIAIDRQHNLGGKTISLRASNDNFTTWSTVFSVLVPIASTQNQRLSQLPGVLTDEGTWMHRFTPHAAKYWRLYIEAGGTEYRPLIPGLYLGIGYEPTYFLDLPYDDESGEVFFDQVVSSTAWVATTNAAARRGGQVHIKLSSQDEYDTARYHIIQLFRRKITVMWIVFDQSTAERAVLALAQPGQYSFPQTENWSFRQTLFDWIEHEPKPAN